VAASPNRFCRQTQQAQPALALRGQRFAGFKASTVSQGSVETTIVTSCSGVKSARK